MKAWVVITDDENKPITEHMPIDENGLIPMVDNHIMATSGPLVIRKPAMIPIRSLLVTLHYSAERRRFDSDGYEDEDYEEDEE